MILGDRYERRLQLARRVDSILCIFHGEDCQAGIAYEFNDFSAAPDDRLFARDVVILDERCHFLVALSLE